MCMWVSQLALAGSFLKLSEREFLASSQIRSTMLHSYKKLLEIMILHSRNGMAPCSFHTYARFFSYLRGDIAWSATSSAHHRSLSTSQKWEKQRPTFLTTLPQQFSNRLPSRLQKEWTSYTKYCTLSPPVGRDFHLLHLRVKNTLYTLITFLEMSALKNRHTWIAESTCTCSGYQVLLPCKSYNSCYV